MTGLVLIVVFAAPLAWSLMAVALRRVMSAATPLDDASEKRQLFIMLAPVGLGVLLICLSYLMPVHIVLPMTGGDDDAVSAAVKSVAVASATRANNDLPDLASMAVLMLWAVVAAAKAGRLMIAFATLGRAAAAARKRAIDGHMVRISQVEMTPFAWGRGIIVLPQSLVAAFDADALRLVIRHEFAHLRRGDPDYFAFLSWIDAIFWFNPAVRAQTARCRVAAEIACDAAVLSGAPALRKTYARVLIETLKHTAGNALACAPAVFSNVKSGDYRMRIQEIMHSGRARRKSGPWLYGALAVTAIPIVCAQLAWSQGVPVAAKLTAAPVDSAVTSPFGMRPDPMGKGMKFHGGVDFAVPTGTPVHAPGDGKVGAVYSNAKDGKVLEIGYGGGLTTRMTHLDSTSVKWGDKVKTGDVVAMSGATGSVTGPHLHFEVRVKGKQVNPATMDTALAGSAQSQ